MVRALVVAALLLGACKKSGKPDCDGAGKAIEAAAAKTAAEAKDDLARETAKRVGPAAAANVVLRCKQDNWSAAATDCVKSAKPGEQSKCESKLTKEQVDHFRASVPAIEGTMTGGNMPSGNAGGTAEPPPGPPADCDGVEASMTRFWNERVSNAKSDAERKAMEELRVTARTRIGKHCRDDHWSAAAGDCFKAVTNGDFASCEGKLTQHQIGSLKMSAPAIPSPLPGPPTTPPAPTGSAETGSAANEAGSATNAGSGSGSSG